MRRETGRKKRMKEPYIEGIANHDDPESCVCDREIAPRSADRGMLGLGIEPRNQPFQEAHAVIYAEGNSHAGVLASQHGPCAVGDPMHEQNLSSREPGDLPPVRDDIGFGPHHKGQSVTW